MTAWTTAGEGTAGMERSLVPRPTPGPHEALVAIAAPSLNFRDLLVVNGRAGWRPSHPTVPLSDAVGTVVETGHGVAWFSVGDRVTPIFLPTWHTGQLTKDTQVRLTGGPVHRGMLDGYVTLHEDEAAPVLDGVDDEHAAT